KIPFKIEVFLHGQRQPLIINFAQALAGTQPPKFGYVYRDNIAVGEMGSTAVQIGGSTTGGQSAGKSAVAAKKPSSAPGGRR
ncbi:MAG: hypothetical protein ACHRHE_10425, partial [Tepidisphaerales bacterium]